MGSANREGLLSRDYCGQLTRRYSERSEEKHLRCPSRWQESVGDFEVPLRLRVADRGQFDAHSLAFVAA